MMAEPEAWMGGEEKKGPNTSIYKEAGTGAFSRKPPDPKSRRDARRGARRCIAPREDGLQGVAWYEKHHSSSNCDRGVATDDSP